MAQVLLAVAGLSLTHFYLSEPRLWVPATFLTVGFTCIKEKSWQFMKNSKTLHKESSVGRLSVQSFSSSTPTSKNTFLHSSIFTPKNTFKLLVWEGINKFAGVMNSQATKMAGTSIFIDKMMYAIIYDFLHKSYSKHCPGC